MGLHARFRCFAPLCLSKLGNCVGSFWGSLGARGFRDIVEGLVSRLPPCFSLHLFEQVYAHTYQASAVTCGRAVLRCALFPHVSAARAMIPHDL